MARSLSSAPNGRARAGTTGRSPTSPPKCATSRLRSSEGCLFEKDLSRWAADIHRAMTIAGASMDPLLSVLAPSRQLRPARDCLRSIVDGLIDERCASADDGSDLVSVLYRAENHIVTEQLRDDVCTLFVAGHETIANALTWTWLLLAQHVEAEARLHDELRTRLGGRLPSWDDCTGLTYTGWVLAESLRLFPPSWIITRRAIQGHEIGGTFIPPGALIVVSQHLLHRDPRFFLDPLAFRPERWGSHDEHPRPKLAYLPLRRRAALVHRSGIRDDGRRADPREPRRALAIAIERKGKGGV